MNVIYHLARADFLERTRRYSFLIMLGLVLYLGYLVNIGQITLRLETYRGVFNSAWVGSMMTLVVNFLLGWFGFYLVKNSIARDYETGVGQIMATTPLSRPVYLLGKWLSNFMVLDLLVLILMLAAVAMQFIQREAPQIDFWALSAPFLFVALPFMALVAALAVLFESISWLRGSFGNVVYFFLFIMVIAMVAIMFGGQIPLLDWLGFGVFKSSMAIAAQAAYPAYQGGLALSMVPASAEIQPFEWAGVDWTLSIILPRLAIFGLAIGLTLLGALFFDRFDTSRARLRGKKAVSGVNEPGPSDEMTSTTAESNPTVRLTPLTAASPRFHFGTLFLAELRLLLYRLPWWWYLVAVGLIAASFFLPLETLRQNILPAALVWPLLVWSGLGYRETRHDTRQMVFSAPRPLWNQIPVAWLAGFVVALLMGGGTLVRFGLADEIASQLSLAAGLLFIPSLALALGVWTGSSKAFEVVYVVFWYLGLLNKVLELDYLGLHTPQNWPVYLLLSLALFALALLGRQRQLKS
ncbi:MAG: hypothetical protein CVU44_09660 [Chloroflexi bacterium HGW-Chloroflexi-6]|nr:MAG: hypothetical protein CVU44_09660 [Chloroflexi bacterium HGW-Chloroflexi-6]